MITMYCVGTTPVSNVVSILVTNIFSTLAVNFSKILIIYFYYWIHALRLNTFTVGKLLFPHSEEGWACCTPNVVQTLVFCSRLLGLNRHWLDLVHPLSENYLFHSRNKVGPIVSQHCTNVGNQQSISYIGPTFNWSSQSAECHDFSLGKNKYTHSDKIKIPVTFWSHNVFKISSVMTLLLDTVSFCWSCDDSLCTSYPTAP